MNLYFSYKFREWLDVFSLPNCVKIILSWIGQGRRHFPIETWKFCRRDSHCLKYAEHSDFTLLFCRERLRNIQSLIIMHMLSHCSAQSLNLFFYHVPVATAIVVCLRSLICTGATSLTLLLWVLTALLLLIYLLLLMQHQKLEEVSYPIEK